MEFGTGISSRRNLVDALDEALSNSIERYITGEPDSLVIMNAGYGVDKKLHKEAVKLLNKKYPNSKIAGTSVPGIFTDEGYSIRGIGILAQKGLETDIVHTNRIRAGVKRKSKKIAKNINKKTEKLSYNDHAAILFAPGYNFPRIMVRLLQREAKGFNPFFAMNLPPIKWFSRPIKFFGKGLSRMMDNFGIGFSYSSLFDGLLEFNKVGIKGAGSFAMDALYLGQPRSWHSKGITSTGLISVLFYSNKLKFGISSSNGITLDYEKPIKINSNIPGGFLTKINGKWGAEHHLKHINCPSEVFYRNSKSRFFLDPFYVFCVEGDSEEIGTYVLVNNPNIKPLLSGLPHSIIDNKTYANKLYFGIQSANDILQNTFKGLEEAKSNANIEKIKFGIFFDCVNRALAVGDSFKKLHKVYKDFMCEAPFIGALSGGEIITGVKGSEFPVKNASIISFLAGA